MFYDQFIFQLKNLSSAIDVLAHDKSVRAVIIRSLLPNVFCAGADLKERATMTPVEVQKFVTSLRGLLKDIEQLPVPVISALDGMYVCLKTIGSFFAQFQNDLN